MKIVLTSAANPNEYTACLTGWQRSYAEALRHVVLVSAPELEERLKWGHIVYFSNGPVLLIRAEPTRVLFGFWEGQRLRHIEPRLKRGGKYQMATLELKQGTPLLKETAVRLTTEAAKFSRIARDAKVTDQPSTERAA